MKLPLCNKKGKQNSSVTMILVVWLRNFFSDSIFSLLEQTFDHFWNIKTLKGFFFIIWLFYLLKTKLNSNITKVWIDSENCHSIRIIFIWKSRFDYFAFSRFEIPNFCNGAKENNNKSFWTITHLRSTIVSPSTNNECLAIDLNWTMNISPLVQARKPRPIISIKFRHTRASFSHVTTNE